MNKNSQISHAAGQAGRNAGRGKPQIRQKIQHLITIVPRDTNQVRNELETLGISRQKQNRWKREPFSTINPSDAIILRDYFRGFPELGVQNIDDLYEMESEHEFAEKKGFKK